MFLFSEADVLIGLEIPSYTVFEGTPVLEVCAIVREGTVNTDVLVVLSTQPNSAMGGQSPLLTACNKCIFIMHQKVNRTVKESKSKYII